MRVSSPKLSVPHAHKTWYTLLHWFNARLNWLGRTRKIPWVTIQITCRKCCTIQFHAKKKGKDSHIWTNSNQNEILTSHKTRALFHTFPLTLTLTLLFIQNVLSNRDYLLIIYTFMCMIIFLRIIILSFFFFTKSAFLARGWEWRGIRTDCPEMGGFNFLYRSGQLIIWCSNSYQPSLIGILVFLYYRFTYFNQLKIPFKY